MSRNEKKEEKWTFHFRTDQCDLIAEAMRFVVGRCDERLGNISFAPFDRFTSEQIKKRALEIADMIAEVTS